jgi:serine/threonine-protein kinase RsbW
VVVVTNMYLAGAASPRAPAISFFDLAGTTQAPGEARRLLREKVGTHPSAEDMVLAASELVTNAVRHTRSGHVGGKITVVLIELGDTVRVEVIDYGSTTVPQVVTPCNLPECGRGLALVEELSQGHWGHYADADGTTVWCQIASALVPA